MNYKIIFMTLLVSSMAHTAIIANNYPITINEIEEITPIKTSMNLEIDGAIKLYSITNEDDKRKEIIYSRKENAFSNWILNPYKYFYMGTEDDVELITRTNYKRLVKKYFADAPELVQKVGKRGFRFKNLPTMILYYNKKVTTGNGLTKEDIIETF